MACPLSFESDIAGNVAATDGTYAQDEFRAEQTASLITAAFIADRLGKCDDKAPQCFSASYFKGSFATTARVTASTASEISFLESDTCNSSNDDDDDEDYETSFSDVADEMASALDGPFSWEGATRRKSIAGPSVDVLDARADLVSKTTPLADWVVPALRQNLLFSHYSNNVVASVAAALREQKYPAQTKLPDHQLTLLVSGALTRLDDEEVSDESPVFEQMSAVPPSLPDVKTSSACAGFGEDARTPARTAQGARFPCFIPYTRQGDMFGVYDLLVPQVCQLKAVDDTVVLELPISELRRVIVGAADERWQRVCLLLAALPFFDKLPIPRLASLADAATDQSYSLGECILGQDDVLRDVYVVMSGCVSVRRRYTRGYSPVVIGRLECGAFFGDEVLLEGRTSRAAAEYVADAPGTQVVKLAMRGIRRITGESSELQSPL